MNTEQNKLKGSINTSIGGAKETAGRALGNKDLQDEGTAQKTRGQVQKFKGAVQDAYQKGKDLLGIRSKRS